MKTWRFVQKVDINTDFRAKKYCAPNLKKYALIGTAGYIAPRHFRAIKETGGDLVAVFDPHDAVGQLDKFFPNAASFTEFERFDRHLEKLNRAGNRPDFLVVCSPNYLHDAHVRFGLRSGMDVICEKPLVLSPWNVDALAVLERETGRKVWTILQLRLHPKLLEWKRKVENASKNHVFEVDLTYITPRGLWYFASWKGDETKSGGILTNIGIHLFDLLLWIFGEVEHSEIHQKHHARAAGFLKFKQARVKWFLSIETGILAEFSDGFDDLHTESYHAILENIGSAILEAKKAVDFTHFLRSDLRVSTSLNTHPFCEIPIKLPPFIEN
jgi:UDP-N-acetyl-2-amino-2-deoxyglucuronate dehydrogenase